MDGSAHLRSGGHYQAGDCSAVHGASRKLQRRAALALASGNCELHLAEFGELLE